MRSALTKINALGLGSILGLTFIYIVFKVLNVPITHDEVATTVHYSEFSAWDIMMYRDVSPNNHILNTLSTKLCLFLFGGEQWAVRLPNLLSFFIYAFAIYRILKSILTKDSLFYIPAVLLFVASPYLLDFFGLSRGYGMSVAFCTLSVSYLLNGFANSNNKNIWYAVLFSVIACYANFTLLVFWAAVTILSWFYFYSSYRLKRTKLIKPTLILLGLSLAYLALIVTPLYQMQSTNQFEFWTSKGFMEETIRPLISHSKYDSKIFITADFLAWFSVVLLALNSVFVFIQFKKNKYSLKTLVRPIAVATLLLLLTSGISILEVLVLDVPNLNGRTALFFYPLFMVMLISSYELFSRGKFTSIKIGFSVLMTALLLHHVIHTAKPYSVREWSYDANTLRVLKFIEHDRSSPNDDASLATDWMFNPSFHFYSYTKKTPWLKLELYNYEINPDSKAQYYYIFAEDYLLLESGFEPVIKFDNNCWLLKVK